MSVCDETCKSCIYSTAMSTWGICCNYILVTGNMRRCPAGKGCERRIVGEKAVSIDTLIFKGQMLTNDDERKEKKRDYNREYYEKNKDALIAKMKERNKKYAAERKANQQRDKEVKSYSELKQRTKERTQKICQGKQSEVIKKYREESGLTNAQIGALCGVTATTIQKWANEHNLADWGKLAQLGIKKPILPGEERAG